MIREQDSLEPMGRWNWLPLAPPVAVGFWLGAQFALWAWTATHFPYELDYGEGPILAQLHAADAGHGLYESWREPPHTVTNYPPVFRAATRFAAWFTGDYLSAGRWVSVLALFASAALAAWAVGAHALDLRRRGACSGDDYLAALAFALTAGGAVLAPTYAFLWGVLLRVDTLAVACSLAAVVVSARAFERSWGPYAVGVLLIAALFTKQSMLAAPAACVAAACVQNLGRGLRFTAGFVGAGFLLLILATLFTDGGFWNHLVTANRNHYSWPQACHMLASLMEEHGRLVVLGGLGGLWQFTSWMQTPHAERPHPRLLWCLYGLTAFATSLMIGKAGAFINYQLEFLCVCGVLTGLLLADLLAAAPPLKELWGKGLFPVLGACGAILLLTVQFVRFDHLKLLAEMEHALQRRLEEQDPFVLKALRDAPGAVLSEDTTLVVLAGKELRFQPFEMTQLAEQGLWIQGPFLDELRNRRYDRIVLKFDLFGDPSWHRQRFSDAMLDVMREHYEFEAQHGALRVYRPKRNEGGDGLPLTSPAPAR
ncbi:MAG: hypothetical protein AMXMBFR7_02270 [Planctomycetota bacterium]